MLPSPSSSYTTGQLKTRLGLSMRERLTFNKQRKIYVCYRIDGPPSGVLELKAKEAGIQIEDRRYFSTRKNLVSLNPDVGFIDYDPKYGFFLKTKDETALQKMKDLDIY